MKRQSFIASGTISVWCGLFLLLACCITGMAQSSTSSVDGTVVDPQGNVVCVQRVSGHPLIIGVAIDSVRRWKFEPYASKGVKKGFCGNLPSAFRPTSTL